MVRLNQLVKKARGRRKNRAEDFSVAAVQGDPRPIKDGAIKKPASEDEGATMSNILSAASSGTLKIIGFSAEKVEEFKDQVRGCPMPEATPNWNCHPSASHISSTSTDDVRDDMNTGLCEGNLLFDFDDLDDKKIAAISSSSGEVLASSASEDTTMIDPRPLRMNNSLLSDSTNDDETEIRATTVVQVRHVREAAPRAESPVLKISPSYETRKSTSSKSVSFRETPTVMGLEPTSPIVDDDIDVWKDIDDEHGELKPANATKAETVQTTGTVKTPEVVKEVIDGAAWAKFQQPSQVPSPPSISTRVSSESPTSVSQVRKIFEEPATSLKKKNSYDLEKLFEDEQSKKKSIDKTDKYVADTSSSVRPVAELPTVEADDEPCLPFSDTPTVIRDLLTRDLWSTNLAVVESALDTMADFCFHSGTASESDVVARANRREILRLGGHLAIVVTLHQHSSDISICESAMRALVNLSLNSTRAKELVPDVGGIDAILHLMTLHPKSARLQDYGCACLGNLMDQNDENAMKFQTAGGMATVIAAMKRHKVIEELQFDACTLIAEMCQLDNGFRAQWIANGAASVLATVLETANGFDESTRDLARGALYFMTQTIVKKTSSVPKPTMQLIIDSEDPTTLQARLVKTEDCCSPLRMEV